jgi:UPF0271 protein
MDDMPGSVDLNADLGEEITDDAALLAVVTSANVACGYHAGTTETMVEVCRIAAERGVTIGAQVSYRDRDGFGRREMDVPHSELADQVAEQIGTLGAIAARFGTAVSYVKPHGALYHRVGYDAEQASAVLTGSGGLPVLGLPGSVILDLALDLGRSTWREGFPDRGYTADGRLVPRGSVGALVSEPTEVGRRAVEMADRVDSLCLHGDSPGAVHTAQVVRSMLADAGFVLQALGSTGSVG